MHEYHVQIKKIHIRNFRKFENLEFDFETDSSYQVFCGRNSAGKTTVLEAINIALSENTSKFNTIKETDFYSEEPIQFEIEFTEPFFFVYEYEGTGYNRLIPSKKIKKTISRRVRKEIGSFFSPQYKIDTEAYPEPFKPSTTEYNELKNRVAEYLPDKSVIVTEFDYDDEERPFYTIASDKDPRYLDGFFDFKYLKKELFPKVFYIDKNRDRELSGEYNTTFARILEELDWKYKKELLKNNDDTVPSPEEGGPTERREALIMAFKEVHESISQMDATMKDLIEPIMENMVNNLGLDFKLRAPSFLFFDMYRPYSTAIFGGVKDSQQIIPIASYGSGFNSLTALYFMIELADKAKESIIILIDEPELHLHADLQKSLKRFVKQSSFQAFVSTHSHLFLDFQNPPNNWSFEDVDMMNSEIKKCDQIDLGNIQFALLGNSLDDLYIPDQIILVEGRYDVWVLTACLSILNQNSHIFALLDCGGYTNIPDKAQKYEAAIQSIIDSTERYKNVIRQDLRVLVDGDVEQTKVDGWKFTFQLDDEDLIKLNDAELSFEYLYPESIVKECVKDVMLADQTRLSDKTRDEIVKIIIADDKESNVSKRQQQQNRVSKQRLSQYVAKHITASTYQSDECLRLREVVTALIKE